MEDGNHIPLRLLAVGAKMNVKFHKTLKVSNKIIYNLLDRPTHIFLSLTIIFIIKIFYYYFTKCTSM